MLVGLRRGKDSVLDKPSHSPDLAKAVIVQSVHCRRCGYDQRGLPPTGRCPECGLETWETILHLIDPAASRLPKLRNPKAVGNGILIIMVCAFAAVAAIVVEPVAAELDLLKQRSDLHRVELLMVLSTVAALAGLTGPWLLMPPRGQEMKGPVRRDVWLIAMGFFGFAVLEGLRWWLWSESVFLRSAMDVSHSIRTAIHLCLCISAIVMMAGLSGALKVIGQRSRSYRNASGGRQSIRAMIAAIVGLMIGLLLRWIANLWPTWQVLDTPGQMISWACMLMILVGLGYLVVNAWWIRSAVRKPPPPLSEIVRAQSDAPQPGG